jgi:exosortase/archaeosortase family protein
VGVEEACSGVRSLVSCVFAGLFFSATLVRPPWARALLIALAAPLALGANFLRSLALTLMANRGIDISGTWHDVTGFAVLGVTATLLGGLALALDRAAPSATPAGPPPPATGFLRRTGLDRTLAVALGCALALVTFFIANTRPSPRHDTPVPDLFALLPASAAGWQIKTSDLYEFRGTLKTEHLAQRHYSRLTERGPVEITLYVAYWRAGQAPVSLVASHTPDACWPGSGWVAVPAPEPQAHLTAADRTLPAAEHRIFRSAERPQHVWFWHLYNRRPIQYQDPYSPLALLELAVRYGFRHAGDQVFVRISSNRPWAEIASEPLLGDFFRRTQSLGL